VATLQHPYLNLAAMEALRGVRLHPRGAAEGTFAGPHKSHFRGTAVEFADYREYTRGDPPNRIDWAVYARTDRHVIRRYQEETNVRAYILLDTSESLAFRETGTMSKWDYACHLAAGVMYALVRQGDMAALSSRNFSFPTASAHQLVIGAAVSFGLTLAVGVMTR